MPKGKTSKTNTKKSKPKSVRDKPAKTRPIAKFAPDLLRRPGSKQAIVIGLLSRAEGATIAAIMNATGWQQHSVRGFFAGVVRKKLQLKLKSEKIDGERVYRIVTSGGSRSGTRQSRQLSA